ncbi:hypothetical protein NHQ30_006946 [Ciborinia camelliae]|nr:hypothetical protein NHQ30_006946 [Ciborinia camelliae]
MTKVIHNPQTTLETVKTNQSSLQKDDMADLGDISREQLVQNNELRKETPQAAIQSRRVRALSIVLIIVSSVSLGIYLGIKSGINADQIIFNLIPNNVVGIILGSMIVLGGMGL